MIILDVKECAKPVPSTVQNMAAVYVSELRQFHVLSASERCDAGRERKFMPVVRIRVSDGFERVRRVK